MVFKQKNKKKTFMVRETPPSWQMSFNISIFNTSSFYNIIPGKQTHCMRWKRALMKRSPGRVVVAPKQD